MSVHLTVRQKVIRVLSSAVVGGLSVSFLVGETVDNKAHLLSKWESDPELLPSDFKPLAPISAAVKMIQAEEWRNAMIAKNGGMGTLPPSINVVASPARTLASVEAVSAPASPIRPAVEIPPAAPVPAASRAEAPRSLAAAEVVKAPAASAKASAPLAEEAPKMATAIPYAEFYGPATPANFAAAAPRKAPLTEVSKPAAKLAANESVSPSDVQTIIASMKDASGRLSAYPRKTAANAQAAATISDSIAVKEVSAAPMEVASAARSDGMMVITGAPDEAAPAAPSPVETVGMTKVEAGAAWKIPGKILAPANLPKGHFEVGLFSKIDQDGVPIGFPVVQQILPSGVLNFELKVPGSLEKGFLYGEFVATKTGQRTWIAPPLNPWLNTDRNVAELTYQAEDAVTTVAASVMSGMRASESFKVTGSVGTLFTKPGSPIPQEEVLVKVRGRKESTRTTKDGTFQLDLPKIKGTVYLEFLKPGYHPSVVAVNTDGDSFQVKVELASREAVEQVARMLGIRQITAKGVFIGRAHGADGAGLRGLSVQSSVKAEGPFYFNEDGFPSADRKNTSSDGRFLFLNLDSGAGYIESSLNGEPIAPFQFSTVEGGELVSKHLSPVGGSIKGRIFNPVAGGSKVQALSGARVRIEGAADYAVSDSYGAFTIGPVRWMKGERIFLELSAEKYNNHRYSVSPDKQKTGLNMYAFPAQYISRLARSMDVDLDPYAGLVMGKVLGSAVRIDALADHSPVNAAKDFYFDARGQLRGSHTMTDPEYGTYVIFNVPKGRTLLQGNDSSGTLRYSEAVVSSPSSVSVIME